MPVFHFRATWATQEMLSTNLNQRAFCAHTRCTSHTSSIVAMQDARHCGSATSNDDGCVPHRNGMRASCSLFCIGIHSHSVFAQFQETGWWHLITPKLCAGGTSTGARKVVVGSGKDSLRQEQQLASFSFGRMLTLPVGMHGRVAGWLAG